MNFLPAVLKAVNCVDTVDIFKQLRQGEYSFWGAAKFQVDVKAGEGGRGSDLNVQLTLSGGKANMSTAPYRVNIASVRLTFLL